METTPDPETLLRRALTDLAKRDFSSSRNLAAQAVKIASDPRLAAEADRILTVAGILLARHREDLYAVLRITRAESDDSDLLWCRYLELAQTLTKPELNDIAFSQEAYDVAYHAFSVLSDPEMKRKYDDETETHASPSFWTVCPYCFWLFQYGKVYEECCLRCQNCSRTFHGVAIGDPPADTVVPGKDQYIVGHGIFPLGYRAKEKAGDTDAEGINNGGSDFRTDTCEKVGGDMNLGRRVAKAPARRMKNVKAVAEKKKKKLTEEEINGSFDSVYFEEHDDDLFVGLEDLDLVIPI